MKQILSALLLLAAALAAHAGEPLRVASYNLRLNVTSDGPNAWPHRKALVQALIRREGWDLFGTQEGLPDQIADLERMDEFQRIGVGRDDGASGGEHAAIFLRRARFEVLRHGDFWLSETPDRPSKGWDGRCCKRMATWVELRDRVAPQAGSFFVFNTHFDHEGQVARRESARLLLARVAVLAGTAPTLVLGDFNSTPDSEPIQILGQVLSDARRSSRTPPLGPQDTFNDFRVDVLAHDRIDYVFHTADVEVLGYAVLEESVKGRLASDHHPVVVVVRLPEVHAGWAPSSALH